MKQEVKSKKEINLLILVFIFIGILGVGINSFEYYTMQKMSAATTSIFEHPLKVTNAALTINVDVYKIHRDMKDIVLSLSQKEIIELLKEVNEHEQRVYKNLNIIEQNILGVEGATLQKSTKQLFDSWKPIRDEVIALMQANQTRKAIEITQGKGANHVKNLEASALYLYEYAQNKAIDFKNKSEASFEELKIISFSVSILFLLIFTSFGLYVIHRIAKFIYKNEHLKSVLSVIRDVNQLIVREKDKQKLLKESCNILTSKHVYANAWIVTLDKEKKIDYLINTDTSENATLFKEKIESGWLPLCLKKVSQTDQTCSTIENTKDSCEVCPLMDLYDTKSAVTIKLIHGEIIYGYLTLSVNNKYIADSDELALLDEVAGDIAYALYNLDIETEKKEALETIFYLNELYGNIINSVENILFVKDLNGIYITCNKAFEKFVGKSKEEIIGKSDYDLVDKELADFFREHDKKMLLKNKATSNFEWVTYPNGDKVYLLTVKAPLVNSEGNVLGVVGNAVDLTKQFAVEKLLEDKKKELETIFDKAPTPMAIHNEDGAILMINKMWKELTGYTHEEIDSISKWTTKAALDGHKSRKEHIESLYGIQERVEEGEFEITTKNGDKIIWVFYSTPLGIIDGKRTLISSAMDITELKKKDAMLISQSRLAAMGEMIGMIAHQWRQPIAGIAMDANNMLLDIALNDFDINKAEEYSISIIDQTEHLSKTIDDFRNFFKPDKTLSTVKLKDIIEETFAIVKDSLKNNSIQFKASYDSDTEVEAYPRELMQVFVNIINNAKDSLVANKIADALITVKVYDDDEYVNTEVCDNGAGIDKEILAKIFDPYFTTKDEKTGTGLGLYMSKMIIEEHLKGKIEVSSEKRDTCFKIRLPIIKSSGVI